MNHKTNSPNNISAKELINLLCTSPEVALESIIETRIYLSKGEASDSFWELYRSLDLNLICNENPGCEYVFHFIGKLHLFYDLYKIYSKQITQSRKQLKALNPSQESLLKALFLSVELSDIFPSNKSLPEFSFRSLTAIKEILKEFRDSKTKRTQSIYSIELFNCAKELLMLKIDLATLFEFINAYEWGGFDIEMQLDNSGYIMSLPEGISIMDNLYVLNKIKTEIKQAYKRQEAHKDISEEIHFKLNDSIFRTNEGLATMFYSGAEIISKPEGVTALKVDEALFDKIASPNQQIQQEGQLEMIGLVLEQNFHYQLRQALSSIYYPNDILDLHKISLTIEGGITITLYDLFCATSCLTALADNIRYLSEFPGKRGLVDVKTAILSDIQQRIPSLDDEELETECVSVIACHLSQIETSINLFRILDKTELITHLRRVEELKTKTDTELSSILDTISSTENSLAFSPIYECTGGYYFSSKTCNGMNINRMIYDYYCSDQLFNTKSISPNNKTPNHIFREKALNESIKQELLKVASYAVSNLQFPKNGEKYSIGLNGEFDDLAYFETENILFAIQVKLSNTSIKNEKGKHKWIKNNLLEKGCDQVNKDVNFLSSVDGLKFVSEQLGLNRCIEQPLIYHLIVTDNFYADHFPLPYNSKGDCVLCISYFELFHLINNIRVNSQQDSWDNVIDKKSGMYLLSLIEDNIFWNFLDDKSRGNQISKSLKLINQENSIKLVV